MFSIEFFFPSYDSNPKLLDKDWIIIFIPPQSLVVKVLPSFTCPFLIIHGAIQLQKKLFEKCYRKILWQKLIFDSNKVLSKFSMLLTFKSDYAFFFLQKFPCSHLSFLRRKNNNVSIFHKIITGSNKFSKYVPFRNNGNHIFLLPIIFLFHH